MTTKKKGKWTRLSVKTISGHKYVYRITTEYLGPLPKLPKRIRDQLGPLAKLSEKKC